MSKDKVLALLPSLNKDELDTVIAVASQLLGGQGCVQPGTDTALVFDAISKALNRPWRADTGMLPPTIHKPLTEKVPELILFFNTYFAGWDETKTLKIAFLREMMAILRDDLAWVGIKPTYVMMVRNLSNIGKAFDKSFPDYLPSGLGPLFVKRLKSR